MATIPLLPEAQKMVDVALRERTPQARASLEAIGALPEFLSLYAAALQERMTDLWTPPNPGERQPLLEAMRDQAEALTAAVERVQAEMLSTEALMDAASLRLSAT